MVKVFLQQEISDCGVCCLETIIDYYGGYVPLETLRIETNTNEFGTNAYNLIECAKKYGFNSKGIKVTELTNIKLPSIAHIKINNLYHFIVIYKITNKYIYTVDPASGKIKYKLESFNKIFTGVILEFFPYTKIPKLSKNTFLKKILINELSKNKKTLIKILIFNLIILILSLLISLEVKILKNQNLYLMIFIIIIIFNELIVFLKNKILILVNNKINNNLIIRFLCHIFKLPSNYLTLKNNGEIATRFNEINDLTNNILSLLINVIFYLLLMIFLTIIILNISLFIGQFIIIISIIIIIINYYLYKSTYPLAINSIKSEEEYKSIILDYINKIETIKNIKIYNYFIKRASMFNKLKNEKTYNLNMKTNKLSSIKNIILNLANLIYIFIVLKNKNINDSLLLIVLFNYIISIINTLIDTFPTYFYIKSIFYKISEFMSVQNQSKNNYIKTFNKINIINFNYKINFKPLLNNINININKNDKILIKGKSGIGKSTLVKTLYKINNNYEGDIYFDNKELRNININSLISYTSQNDSLFYDTIKNNIVLNRKISKQELNAILKITRINEIQIIKEIGLDSLILNNTINISGGEKNRIIMARSLISRKEIIILDEVLSQVDYNLEKEILKDMLDYFKNKTIIYISHRNVSMLFNKVIDLNERSINGIRQ